jgi:hypothetical protein
MDAAPAKALTAFGFLTVLESAEHGLFGGYLVLSPQGRPLEFRCSTPVSASRAQEILYGPTLRPYLYAEVIGQALVAGAELHAAVILTDQPDMLSLGLLRPEEILLVQETDPDGATFSVASATAGPSHDADEPPARRLVVNGCEIVTSSTSTKSPADVAAMLQPLATHVYLTEPFQRIRAALNEAQLASQDDGDSTHDRAAA